MTPRARAASGLPGYDPDEVVAVARSVVPHLDGLDEESLWRELRIAATTIDAWAADGVVGLAKRLAEKERKRQFRKALRDSLS